MAGGKRERGAHRARVEIDGAAAGEPAPHAHAVAGARRGVDLPVGALEAADHDRRAAAPDEQRRRATGARTSASSQARPSRRVAQPGRDRARRDHRTRRPARRSRIATDGGVSGPSSSSAGKLPLELGEPRARAHRGGRPRRAPPRTAASRSAAAAAADSAAPPASSASRISSSASRRSASGRASSATGGGGSSSSGASSSTSARRSRWAASRSRCSRVCEPRRLDPAAGLVGVVAVGSRVGAGRLGQLGEFDRALPCRHERPLRHPLALELARDRLDLRRPSRPPPRAAAGPPPPPAPGGPPRPRAPRRAAARLAAARPRRRSRAAGRDRGSDGVIGQRPQPAGTGGRRSIQATTRGASAMPKASRKQ